MVERIKSLLAVKNISSSQFANEIGVQRSGISHILSGRNKPSLDFIMKILEHYPEISESWLLKGEGEMLKKDSQAKLFNEVNKPLEKTDKEDVNQNSSKNITDKTELEESVEMQEKKAGLSDIEMDQLIPKDKTNNIDKIIVIYNNLTFDILTPRK